MLLVRKALRELARQRSQTGVLVLVQGLGIALYVACYGGYLDLRDSYAHSREALALAQVHADVRGVEPGQVTAAAALPGVVRAEGRIRVSLPIFLPEGRPGAAGGGPVAIEARFLSLPDGGEPALDRVHLDEGRLPGVGEVLVERHLAEFHGLRPGDRLEVGTGPGRAALTVAGIGSSAEYLWVWRSAEDPMPLPQSFGVAWVRRSALVELARAYVGEVGDPGAGELSAAASGRDDQVLYDRAPDADPATVDAQVASALGGGVLRVTEAGDLVGPRLLQLDIDGLRTMAYAFPVFFLGVAAFISLAGIARTVDQQREVIGTFLALGMPRRRVLLHYAGFALLTGVASAAGGAVVGQALASHLAEAYASELHIPFVTSTVHPSVLWMGVAAGLVTSAVAGLVPAARAARLAPAAAMRPPAPTAGRLLRASRSLGPVPPSLRLALRTLLRHPVRALGTALGVAAAVVLVVATVAVAQSTQRMADVQLHDVQRYDLRADLAAPLPDAEIGGRLGASEGIEATERSLTLPVVARAHGVQRSLVLSCIVDDAELLRPVDWDGVAIRPERDTLLVPRAEAHKLGVGIGDTVTLDVGDGSAHPVVVGGLVDTALGPVATMRLEAVQARLGVPPLANTVVATVRDPGAARATLLALPGAVGITDAAGLRDQLDTLLALNLTMVGMMLVLAGVLGGAILYNTATLGVLERARELATLRALGAPMRMIAAQSTIEFTLVGVAGLVLGLGAGRPLARALVSEFDSELFTMPFVWSWPATLGAGLVLVALLLLAQIPALRAVARMDLARTVRSREG